MFNKILQALCGTILLASWSACAAVTVDINSERFQFDSNPRLNEVLAPVALQQKWYWPGAALFRLDNKEPYLLRQKVLEQIVKLKLYYHSDKELLTTLLSIEQQVKSWQLAKRINQQVDYDLAKVLPQHNPRFEDGRYLIQLSLRPTEVYVFGAIESPVVLPHQGATPIAEYLALIQLPAAADTDQITVLQPNGYILHAGSEYWNKDNTEAMPGAQLFIPFKTALLNSKFERLNQLLSELAIHRVLP